MMNFHEPDFLVPHGDFSAHCVISVDFWKKMIFPIRLHVVVKTFYFCFTFISF